MADSVPPLDDVLHHAWGEVVRGVRDGKHGFHTATVCTVDRFGTPSGRTVVLRGASPAERTLLFHTDRRAPKVEQLEAGVHWVFYDAKRKLQVRAFGSSAPADGAATEARWAGSSVTSRKCYLVTEGPGTVVGDTWGSGMPEDLQGADLPSPERSEAGRANFLVVQTQVTWMESLYLSRFGHQRARFEWVDGAWRGVWVVP